MNHFSFAFTITVERPLVAVSVENVGNSRESLELLTVVAFETGSCCTNARSFEFGISSEKIVQVNRVIRAAYMVR